MAVVTEEEFVEAESQATKMWWLFLVAGIAWVIVALVVLAFDPTSAATIGFMVAFVLIAGGINEFVTIGFAEGWKWLHAVLGVLFVVTGFMALMAPFQTFGVLALLIGWYLVFKGTFGIILSIAERQVMPLWGLLLGAGIIEVMIGLWAIGYPGRSAWLLILWVGIGALVRGITEIVFAFKLHGARKAIAAA